MKNLETQTVEKQKSFDVSAWIGKGINWKAYIGACKKNVGRMERIYERVSIPEEAFRYFESKDISRVICIAEDWCPDCVQNVPMLVRLFEHFPQIILKLYFRDDNVYLIQHYLTNGKKVIPTVVFFDERLNELGRWAGPSRKAKKWTQDTLIKGRRIEEIPRDEIESFGRLYDEKFLTEFYRNSLEELEAVLAQK